MLLRGVPPAHGGGRKTASILNYNDEKALSCWAWGMGSLLLLKLDLGQVLQIFLQSFPHLITTSPERSLSSSRSKSGHRVTVVDALRSHSQLAEKNISLPQAADSVGGQSQNPSSRGPTENCTLYKNWLGCISRLRSAWLE